MFSPGTKEIRNRPCQSLSVPDADDSVSLGGLFREINRHTLTGWEALEERFRATSPVRCSWKSAVTITLQIVLQLFSAPLGLIWITYLFHVFCAFYNFLQRDWKPGTF